jgi:hypothetical protein
VTHPLDQIPDLARKTYEQHGNHVPLLLGFNGDAQALVVGFQLDRDDALAVCHRMLMEHGCDSYAVVHEAWMSKPTAGRVAMRPSKDPNRVEVLWIVRRYPDGRERVDAWEIDRGRVLEQVMRVDSATIPAGVTSQSPWLQLLSTVR